MGNKNSVQTHLDLVDINTNYIPEMKHTDTRFGEIKVLRRRETNEKIFQKDFTSNSANDYEEYVNKIRKRVPLIHPNILKILGYNSKKEDVLCADFFKLSVFFEGFETDLEKEIYTRNESKNYFSETELRCLLDSIIAACAYLERNQIAHSDLRPYNIFITKSREYKVCDNALFQPLYNPAYFGLLEGLEAKSHYPSPQVFKQYKNNEKTAAEFNTYKNDVYGLGMTILAAAQLRHADDAYDYKNKKVRQEIVDESLRNLKARYSEGFVEAIRVLLTPEEAGRPSFVDLDEEIKAFRSDIRAKANLERTLEAQKRSQNSELYIRSPPRHVSNSGASHYVADDEADHNVRRAVERSEAVINSRSPSKLQNKALDAPINTYLQREPIQGDKPLLYTVAPHLRMNERFVPTLKVYSQNLNQHHHESSNPNTYQTQLFESRYPNHPGFGNAGDQTAVTYNPRERLVTRDERSAVYSGQINPVGQNIVSPGTMTSTSYNYGSHAQFTDRIVESAGYRQDGRIPGSGTHLASNYL